MVNGERGRWGARRGLMKTKGIWNSHLKTHCFGSHSKLKEKQEFKEYLTWPISAASRSYEFLNKNVSFRHGILAYESGRLQSCPQTVGLLLSVVIWMKNVCHWHWHLDYWHPAGFTTWGCLGGLALPEELRSLGVGLKRFLFCLASSSLHVLVRLLLQW